MAEPTELDLVMLNELRELGLEREADAARVHVTDYADAKPGAEMRWIAVCGSKCTQPMLAAMAEWLIERGATCDSLDLNPRRRK